MSKSLFMFFTSGCDDERESDCEESIHFTAFIKLSMPIIYKKCIFASLLQIFKLFL